MIYTLRKKVYLYSNGVHEEYFVDSLGRKQGVYTLYSRKTKKKFYECCFEDNQKVGIENIFDENGNFISSLI